MLLNAILLLICSFSGSIALAGEADLRPLASALTVQRKSLASPVLQVLRGTPPDTVAFRISQPTLVHFWATWCSPCIQELPRLSALRPLLREHGVEILFVSIDSAGPVVVPPFLKKLSLADLDPVWDPRGTLQRRFGATMLPTTVLLERGGKEVARVVGSARWESADVPTLTKILKAQ